MDLKLEVVHFDTSDVIATSGMGVELTGWGDGTKENGLFTFFSGTENTASIGTSAGYDDVVAVFNRFFGRNWTRQDDAAFHYRDGYDCLENLIDRDLETDGTDSVSGYNGRYVYNGHDFHWKYSN